MVRRIISALLAAFMGAIALAQNEEPTQYVPESAGLADGARIAYYDRAGTGPCIVLIPGSWGDYHVFDRVTPALDGAFRVIIVELRGHGGSWPPSEKPSMELFAQDVFSVTDALALDPFYVGGHSIGGMIAIEMAGQRPGAIQGVISIEGWTHHQVARDAFDGALTNTLTPEQEKEREASRARTQSRLTREQIAVFSAVWRQWDGSPILETTSLPIIEIWGDRGRAHPSHEQMRIPRRANIELRWLAGASHSLLIERPLEVAQAINEFVRRVEAGPTHADAPSGTPASDDQY